MTKNGLGYLLDSFSQTNLVTLLAVQPNASKMFSTQNEIVSTLFLQHHSQIFSPKNGEKIGIFDPKQSYIMQKFDHNISFCEKRQFFRRKLSKIAENCHHNIDIGYARYKTETACLFD
jgi:hypothetical protein